MGERTPGGSARSWDAFRASWTARIRDASHFGERQPPPAVSLADLAHRITVLAIVVVLTGGSVAALASPGIALIGRTVDGLAERFAEPIGSAVLPRIAQRSVVLDRNGKVIATLAGEENRIFVALSQVPPHAQKAVLAIEDARFYEHSGVHLGGLVRALLSNVRSGGIVQGGSTITQQLVKNTLVGGERSLDRKIREARLAVRLEQERSKREILELYLNETYFGNGIYGIGTAAEYYFGRRVGRLTLAQSALLAGIIQAPERYEPIENPGQAQRRRALVLRRMVEEGSATRAEADQAARAKLGAKAHPLPPTPVPYFVEFVKAQILDDARFGETRSERAQALFQAGLRIETTLDLGLQKEAKEATEAVLDRKNDPASALVSIDPATGAVRAMVGGRDFAKEKYNLAVQGKRQPGSTFKPFVLVAALDAGLTPAYTLNTPSPITVPDQQGKPYEVSNYDGRGRGWITLREATERSVNTFYVQLIGAVGPRKVVEAAQRLGIQTDLEPYTSLALGTIEVSPFELASAYATLAAGGIYCKPYGIARVTDARGEELRRGAPDCERRLGTAIAAQAIDVLRGVPLRGTGRRNGRIGRPNAAKTGTTDRYTDAWYIGFTPQYSTAVWLGYPEDTKRPLDDIHGLEHVVGGSLPAQIWSRFMRSAHRGLEQIEFPKAPKVPKRAVPDVVGQDVDEATETLEDAGFSVRVRRRVSGSERGTVLAQDPGPGERIAVGALVTITVAKATPVPSPSPSPSPGSENDG